MWTESSLARQTHQRATLKAGCGLACEARPSPPPSDIPFTKFLYETLNNYTMYMYMYMY